MTREWRLFLSFEFGAAPLKCGTQLTAPLKDVAKRVLQYALSLRWRSRDLAAHFLKVEFSNYGFA